MKRIEFDEKSSFEETIIEGNEAKDQFKKSFLGSAGIIVGVFLMCVVVLMTITDIKITSIEDFADIAVEFFALLFVSYQMYVNTSDSGRRAGLETVSYIESHEKYTALRDSIIQEGKQGILPEFCADYIKRELEHTRTVIVANIGMTYGEFLEYLKLGKEGVDLDPELSKAQKKAIKKAIDVSPIKLTPDMIMHGEKNGRSPLGVSPKEKKIWNYTLKLASSAVTSLFFGMLAFEFAQAPDFTTFVFIITRLVPVILNGVSGYMFGYENILFDTVGYMNNQSALIEEFKRFAEQKECKETTTDIKRGQIVVNPSESLDI